MILKSDRIILLRKLIAQANYTKKYVYNIHRGTLNQSLYASNKKNGKKLARYYNLSNSFYKKIETSDIKLEEYISPISGDTVYDVPFVIPVPIKYIGVQQIVYVEQIYKNDSIVKGYVFDTECWGYYKAYIPSVNVHDHPPPGNILQKYIQHLQSLSDDSEVIYGYPSPFGFYCN